MVGRDALRLECPVLLELRIHWASQTFTKQQKKHRKRPVGIIEGKWGRRL